MGLYFASRTSVTCGQRREVRAVLPEYSSFLTNSLPGGLYQWSDENRFAFRPTEAILMGSLTGLSERIDALVRAVLAQMMMRFPARAANQPTKIKIINNINTRLNNSQQTRSSRTKYERRLSASPRNKMEHWDTWWIVRNWLNDFSSSSNPSWKAVLQGSEEKTARKLIPPINPAQACGRYRAFSPCNKKYYKLLSLHAVHFCTD